MQATSVPSPNPISLFLLCVRMAAAIAFQLFVIFTMVIA